MVFISIFTHNFNFIGIEEVGKRDLVVRFGKSGGEWVHKNEFKNLSFLFKNVSYKHLEEGGPNSSAKYSKCLGEITFFPSAIREINDRILTENKPSQDDDMIFQFQDGKVIRINSESVELKTSS